jgi:SAM-dependent methyltransferase
VFAALRWTESPAWIAPTIAAAAGACLSLLGATPWRRVFVAAGFPLSLAVSGVAGAVPGWAWLLPLALLLLVYPLNAWRDAPLFPTPAGALQGLSRLAPLKERARVLDAGCGLGAGLRELRREYPNAQLVGLEWSWPLRLLCALHCRFARVARADIWAADWSAHDMVYLFQRPESMPRAVAKAAHELRPGAYLASLEFEAATLQPQAVLACADGRKLWLYRAPFKRAR